MAKSIEGLFIDWVARQPAERTYDYGSISDCAFCQFLKDTGIAAEPRVGGIYWHDNTTPDARRHDFSERVADALVGDDSVDGWNYGALAARLAERVS
jgi:hypothetical protein